MPPRPYITDPPIAPNYEPNSSDGPKENPEYRERPRTITGSVDRHNHRLDGDYYSQPGNLFRLMKPDAQKRLISNIVGSLGNAPKYIQEKKIGHFLKADPAFGRGVAEGLGILKDEPGSGGGHRQWRRRQSSSSSEIVAPTREQNAPAPVSIFGAGFFG
jgi:catalase